MVDVDDVEAPAARRREPGQGVDQGGRVRPPAAGHHHGLPRAKDATTIGGGGGGTADAANLGDPLRRREPVRRRGGTWIRTRDIPGMSRVLYHLSYTAAESAGGRLRDRADAGTEREGRGRGGCGGWIRTSDLRVMSPTSFHCSTPQSQHSAGRRPLAAAVAGSRPGGGRGQARFANHRRGAPRPAAASLRASERRSPRRVRASRRVPAGPGSVRGGRSEPGWARGSGWGPGWG